MKKNKILIPLMCISLMTCNLAACGEKKENTPELTENTQENVKNTSKNIKNTPKVQNLSFTKKFLAGHNETDNTDNYAAPIYIMLKKTMYLSLSVQKMLD